MTTGGGVIRLCGEMTVQSAAEHKSLLMAALGDRSRPDIELDLSEVSELDTAGLQLLFLLKREAAQVGQHVRLSAASDTVREVLTLARLDDSLNSPPSTVVPSIIDRSQDQP